MASNNIKKLTPYQHVRLRTTVYYGSTSLNTQPVLAFDDKNKLVLVEESWVPAVFTCFREILDNSLDEVVAHGHGNRIDVDFDPSKMRFEIRDNGRGIPFDWDEEHKMHKATLALSELMAGRNFEDRGDTAGMNGIGASGVNFCSVEFIVESRRDGQKFVQRFEEGDEVFGDSLQIFDPKITKYSGTDTGTTITFQLSRKVFSDLTLPENFIRSRVMEVAVCNPHVKFYYNGQHIKVKPRPEQTLFPGKDTIQIDINEEGFKAKFWVIPNFTESGDHSHSIVNNIPAFNGGIQIDTFKRLFIGNLISGLERESKKRKLTPNRSDVSEGLLIFNITRMTKPDFDSQSKTRLINDEVGGILKKHLENPDLYKDIIKKHKSWIDEIYQRCADRTQKKDASEIAKLARKLVRAKVPGLMDATGRDRMKCTLFLAEGLCLDDNTLVKIYRDDAWMNICIADIQIGDLVITHTGSLKPVIAKSHSVKKSLILKTNTGEVTGSPDHRIFVYNFVDDLFEFVAMRDIDINKHKIPKSKLAKDFKVIEIKKTSTELSDYPIRIDFGDEYELCSVDHKYGVFNTDTMSYEIISAEYIDPEIHFMMVK